MILKVTAAIIMKHGKVFIAQKGPLDKRANQWEFPGGKIDPGETPEECLIRELQEEFEIGIKVDRFFTENLYTHSNGKILVMAYFCSWISGKINPTEHVEYHWVFPYELDKYDFVTSDLPIANKLKTVFPNGFV
ncbi:MAG: mutator MutT protein [Firmicutes bacterium]|nr:mutator MutT protein [Bacillota bacterium]